VGGEKIWEVWCKGLQCSVMGGKGMEEDMRCLVQKGFSVR
jgi:hypothetical protein